jgi:hypothetical protein
VSVVCVPMSVEAFPTSDNTSMFRVPLRADHSSNSLPARVLEWCWDSVGKVFRVCWEGVGRVLGGGVRMV